MLLNTLFGLSPAVGLFMLAALIGLLFLIICIIRILVFLEKITAKTKFWFIPYLVMAAAVVGAVWLWWQLFS